MHCKDNKRILLAAVIIIIILLNTLIVCGCEENEPQALRLSAKEQKIVDTLWANRSVWEKGCRSVRFTNKNGKYLWHCSYDYHVSGSNNWISTAGTETVYFIDVENNIVRVATDKEYRASEHFGQITGLSKYDEYDSDEAKLELIGRKVKYPSDNKTY